MSTDNPSPTPVELGPTARGGIPAINFPLDGIDLYVTTSCDRRCSHCFLTDEWLDSRQAMSTDMVTEIVNWATEPGSTIEEVTLLGGEPSRHPNFPGLVQIIHDAALRTRVVTNGSPAFRQALDDYPGLASQITRTSVSIDAPTQEANDKIRGNSGFEWVTATTMALKERDMPFDINTTVLRDNLGTVPQMIEFAEELGAQRVNVHWFSLAGRGRLHAADQVPTPSEWHEIVETVENYTSPRGMSVDCELGFAYGLPGENLNMCKTREASNLQFSPDGTVASCGMLAESPEKSGYLWQRGRLLRRNSNTDELALTQDSNCAGCPIREQVESNIPLCIYNRLDTTIA